MSGSIITVPVQGPATQLSGSSFNAGATIKNLDSVNAVWIANTVSVKPGLGFKLNPLATLQWPDNNGLPFAVCDTGATGPVDINVSDDAENTSDPLSTAIATATALLASGVPAVLTSTVVQPTFPFANGSIQFYDVHEYSTLQLYVNNCTIGDLIIYLRWVPQGTVSTFVEDIITCFQVPPSSTYSLEWEIPVKSGGLTIFTIQPSGGQSNITILGTNQPNTGSIRQVGFSSMPRALASSTQTFTAGVAVPMLGSNTGNGADGLFDYTTLNGEVDVILNNNVGLALTGLIILQFVNGAGVRQSLFYAPPGGTVSVFQLKHPMVPCQWLFYPTVNHAAAFAQIQLVPTLI